MTAEPAPVSPLAAAVTARRGHRHPARGTAPADPLYPSFALEHSRAYFIRSGQLSTTSNMASRKKVLLKVSEPFVPLSAGRMADPPGYHPWRLWVSVGADWAGHTIGICDTRQRRLSGDLKRRGGDLVRLRTGRRLWRRAHLLPSSNQSTPAGLS